MIKFRRKNSS